MSAYFQPLQTRCRANRWTGLAVLLFVLVKAGTAGAAEAGVFQGIGHDRLQLVIRHSYNLEADAPELIDRLQRDFPNSLAPEFIRVTREYWLQEYAEIDRGLTGSFERDSSALIEKTQSQLSEHPDDPDTACLAGLSQLLVGFYNVEKRHWWTAFWKVREGRNRMLRILDGNPDYADAKMAAGLADCYLDRTPGYLKPLTLLLGASGDMDRGMRRLREARDHGLLTSVEAAYYLSGVLAELNHDFPAARDELAPLAARFPDNPFFQQLLGYFELQSGLRKQGSVRLSSIPDMAAARTYPALAVRSQMWLCWYCMGTKEYPEALGAAERAAAVCDSHAGLDALRPETQIGMGEALKALGRYKDAFAHFEAISPDYPDQRRYALERVRAIKAEIGRE